MQKENSQGITPYDIKAALFDLRYINIIHTHFSTGVNYFLEDLGEGHPYRFTSLLTGYITLMQKEDETMVQYEDTRPDLMLPWNCFRFKIITAQNNALTRAYETFSLYKDSFGGMIQRANSVPKEQFVGCVSFSINGNILNWFDTFKPKIELNAARMKQDDILYGEN